MGLWWGVASHLLASEIPKGGSNLTLSEVRKQLLGGFWSRPPPLGPQEKNANFVIQVWYPYWHPWCVHTVFNKFPDRPRLTASLLQRKHDVTDIWMLVCLFLWVWGPSYGSGSGEFESDKWPPASTFHQCVSLNTQYAGKVIFLQGRRGINTECVFRPLSSINCFTSKTWDLQACPEDLSQLRVSPCWFQTLQKHS